MNSITGDRLWASSLEISVCQNNLSDLEINELLRNLCAKKPLHWNNQILSNTFVLQLRVSDGLKNICPENGYAWKLSKC